MQYTLSMYYTHTLKAFVTENICMHSLAEVRESTEKQSKPKDKKEVSIFPSGQITQFTPTLECLCFMYA